jgi:hypothetical protein
MHDLLMAQTTKTTFFLSYTWIIIITNAYLIVLPVLRYLGVVNAFIAWTLMIHSLNHHCRQEISQFYNFHRQHKLYLMIMPVLRY